MDPETTLMLAQQLAERGDFAQALEEYRRLLAQNPADTRVLLRMGDLLVRGQNIPAAIQVYDQAAAYYAHQGHGLKAVAVYKQVRDLVIGFEQIEPGVTDRYAHVVEQLAALYSALGLSNDALRVLDEEATRLRNLERDDDALALFRRMTDLAANVPLPYLRLGEGLYRVGQIDEAIGAFWSAAQLLLASNRSDDALRVIERMLHIKPVPKHAKIAARIYLEKGTEPEGKQALSRLQICFQADPTDLETLQMLSQAFGQIGQPERSVEVQKEIARLAHDQGRMDVLAQALAWLEPLAAEDEQVRALMHLAPPELRASSMPPVPVSSVPPRVSHAPHVPAHASVPPVPQSLAPQSLAPESIALDSIAPSGWPQAEALPPDGDFALQSLPPEAPPHEATQQSVSVAPSSAAPSSGPPISLVPRAASAPSVAPPPPSASRHSPPPKPADHPASSRPPRTHFPPPKPAGRSMRPDAPPSSPIAVPGTPPPLPPKARVSKAPPLPASFLEQAAAAASTSKRPTLERQLVEVSEPPPTVSADRATSPGPSAPVPPPQGIDEVLERSRRALADARAYRGLSLFHKAIETIQSALEFDSRSIELREMLRDLF
ncbi:MAG TPA: tetratricopeptide repeat protein, partial [Polyangiaceae bacterium]|nr:tetratricopeptide repeat protein [Polyangiaceae bacterium]